ncbi:hypothetical protein ACOTF3_04335 [Achromobacter xylosoxidans]
MDSNLILTIAQAQAVYSAMCALNQIGAVIDVDIPDSVDRIRSVRVLGTYAMGVQVEQLWGDHERERYADKVAFAAAYGLRDAPDADDLLAALNTAHMALIGYLPAHRNAVTDAAIETCRATIARNNA